MIPQPPPPKERCRNIDEFTNQWNYNTERGGIKLLLADEQRVKFYAPFVKPPMTEKDKEREMKRVEFLCQREVGKFIPRKPVTKVKSSQTVNRRQLEIENRLLKPYRENDHMANQLFEKVRMIKSERTAAMMTSPRAHPMNESSPESDDENGEGDDNFHTESRSFHKMTVDERTQVVQQRRSTILAVADAELLLKYQKNLEATDRRATILSQRRNKSRQRTPGAVWKSIFLTLLVVNRMRTYINLRKVDTFSVAAQFRSMLVIRNAWIRHRTRMGKRARLYSYDVPVDHDEFGNNQVVPQVTDSLYSVFQYFTREMRAESRRIYAERKSGADLIVSFTRLVSGASGTRGAVRAFIRKIKAVQRLTMKHLRVNQGRLNALQIVMDRIIAAMAPHIFIVAAGRGLDKISDNSKAGVVEKASVELYCKCTDSLTVVRNLLTPSCHAYIRSNIHRIQTCLSAMKQHPSDKGPSIIHPGIKRHQMMDFMFKLRRNYLRDRAEKLRLEKITFKIPEVHTEEVANFLHSSDPNSDPVLVRLLSSIGPAALLHDNNITSRSAYYAVSESIHKSRYSTDDVSGMISPVGISSSSSSGSSSSNHGNNSCPADHIKENQMKVAKAIQTFELMVLRQNQKAFSLFRAIDRPEIVIEEILRIYEKSVELNKQEQHKNQLLMLEEYQKQQMLLLLQKEEELKALTTTSLERAKLFVQGSV